MKFHANGPSIPDVLLERCDAGRVVFLCGAGVSQPSGLPSFVGLTQHVIEHFGPPNGSQIMKAIEPWLEKPARPGAPLDQIFHLLHQEYGQDEVNSLVTERLKNSQWAKDVGREHALIRRISCSERRVPQIVTTNFDTLFETGADGGGLKFYAPPGLPDLAMGAKIEGITYLHGRLADPASELHHYVLSSADFGRAYLAEGWATNFVRSLLDRYTVVLVGYQAEDPPIKYLLQGLSHNGRLDRSRLFAFDRGLPEEIEAKWRDRGVTSVAYADHAELWNTMEAWADRADDPRRWRSAVIASSRRDPKEMASHERGQVAHVLRTVQGARLFSEASPRPHPEWVCVLDSNLRLADSGHPYEEGVEAFDLRQAYGLDEDLDGLAQGQRRHGARGDNLLVWRDGDDNPIDSHRLTGRSMVLHEAMPVRLVHLMTWIAKSIDSPVLAWWAICQTGLHPRLLVEIEGQLERQDGIGGRAKHVWNLILEHHRDPLKNRWRGGWFELRDRLGREGWTNSVLREFRRVASPRVDLKRRFGPGRDKPPFDSWESVRLADLGSFEVKLLEHFDDDLEVPDEVLPTVFAILCEQLAVASGMLADIETSYFQVPTCYPEREVDGEIYVSDIGNVLKWFVKLFDRLSDIRPDLAKAHATIWRENAPFFFRKLKLYAYNRKSVFLADEVASAILSMDQGAFWDSEVARELLFLLADRWTEFSQDAQNRLMDRLLAGPDCHRKWSDNDCVGLRNEYAARYARNLQLQGCRLAPDHSDRLAAIIQSLPEWNDGWATSVVTELGSHAGFVQVDENPDEVSSLPVGQIVSNAKDAVKREFGSFTEKRPFTGLVKSNPRKALAALTLAGRRDDYPEEFWASLLRDFPENASPRLRKVLLHRICRLPSSAVLPLRISLGRWLERNLADVLRLDECLGWSVFDWFIDVIFRAGAEAVQSSLGETRVAGQVVVRSRRTLGHARSGPIGMCAEALFRACLTDAREAGSLIPPECKSRLERLFASPGEGSDHAVSVTMSRLNRLMFLDPEWAERRLVPMLVFDHPSAEPAWNGFLNSGQVPWKPLAEIVRPLLVELFPWIERFAWDDNLFKVAAQWLGATRLSHPDESFALTAGEMRSLLRQMSEATRNQFVFWLGLVGKRNNDGWVKYVIPFINEVWPRERRYRTAASVMAWIGLLDDTGECFPTVYGSVKNFLAPVDLDDYVLIKFVQGVGGDVAIGERFPEATLDLIYRVTPVSLARQPSQLRKMLSLIGESEPKLVFDARYLHLVDLVERS